MAKAFTYTAAVFVGLYLMKNGFLSKIVKDAENGVNDIISGVKPLASQA